MIFLPFYNGEITTVEISCLLPLKCPSNMGFTLKGKDLLLEEQIFFFNELTPIERSKSFFLMS